MSRLRIARAVSAGGVVYRLVGDRVEIVLCGRTSANIWALPKGTPQSGESLDETALREVREETGLDVRILEPIGSIDYWFVIRRKRFHKTVHYYLMEPTGGDISLHDPEYDEIRWVPLDVALEEMTYRNEIDIVQRAARAINRRVRLA